MRANEQPDDLMRPRATTIAVAAAGIFALLAASCCVLPLALAIVGLGGAWLMVLVPFVTHRDVVLAIVAVVLVVAWIDAARRSRCRHRKRAIAINSAATALFAAAVAAPLWEGAAMRGLWALWTSSG